MAAPQLAPLFAPPERLLSHEEDVGSSRKCRRMDDADDMLADSLQAECTALRDENARLEQELGLLEVQALAATRENKQLVKFLAQLKPHKSSFKLAPESSLQATAQALRAAQEEARQLAAISAAPAVSQPAPIAPPLPKRLRVLREQEGVSGQPSNQPTSSMATASDVRTGESGRSAESAVERSAEAVAAAALAVNNGNPAAALVDLLHMYLRKQTAGKPQ